MASHVDSATVKEKDRENGVPVHSVCGGDCRGGTDLGVDGEECGPLWLRLFFFFKVGNQDISWTRERGKGCGKVKKK